VNKSFQRGPGADHFMRRSPSWLRNWFYRWGHWVFRTSRSVKTCDSDFNALVILSTAQQWSNFSSLRCFCLSGWPYIDVERPMSAGVDGATQFTDQHKVPNTKCSERRLCWRRTPAHVRARRTCRHTKQKRVVRQCTAIY